MKYKGRKTYPSYEVGYTFPKGWTCDTPLNVGNPTPIFRSVVLFLSVCCFIDLCGLS